MPEALTFTGGRMPDSGNVSGGIAAFKHVESAASNFVFDTATVIVNAPDGQVSPSVLQLPGTPNMTQTMQAIVNEAIGGPYVVHWNMTHGGQVILRTERYFIAWTELYDQIRGLLRVNSDVVTNNDIDLAVAQMIVVICGPDMFQSVLPNYQSVPVVDRDAFDRGLSLLTAAMMRPWTPKQEAFGDVLAFQTGTDRFEWSATTSPGKLTPIEEGWVDQGWQVLNATSLIGDEMRGIQDRAQIFGRNGRRRNQPSVYEVLPFGQIRINPSFHKFIGGLASIGRDINWSWGGSRW